MSQMDLTMMRIQQNKIISLKVENEDENTVCGEHLIPLVHVNDGVERHLKKENHLKKKEPRSDL